MSALISAIVVAIFVLFLTVFLALEQEDNIPILNPAYKARYWPGCVCNSCCEHKNPTYVNHQKNLRILSAAKVILFMVQGQNKLYSSPCPFLWQIAVYIEWNWLLVIRAHISVSTSSRKRNGLTFAIILGWKMAVLASLLMCTSNLLSESKSALFVFFLFVG